MQTPYLAVVLLAILYIVILLAEQKKISRLELILKKSETKERMLSRDNVVMRNKIHQYRCEEIARKQRERNELGRPRKEIDSIDVEEKQKRILAALQNGEHLTVLKMLRIAHTTEGRKAISRLRRKGFDIRSYKNEGENYNHYYLVN